MLFTEFNMDDALEVAREEGLEQGREQSRLERLEEQRQMVIEMKRKNFTDEVIADIVKLPIEKIKKIVE